jgi:hypothetical protein
VFISERNLHGLAKYADGSSVECLSLILPIFHESLLLTASFPENEEISAPPPS